MGSCDPDQKKKCCMFKLDYFKFANWKCEGDCPFQKVFSCNKSYSCSYLDLNYFNPYSYQLYKDYINESNRKERESAVFLSTLFIGLTSFVFIRRPRRMIRNPLITYLTLSMLICPENFNPIM